MRHLVISYHTCPWEEPGHGLAGGMNIFLRGLLPHLDLETHVLTGSTAGPQTREIQPGLFVHRLPCDYSPPWTRERALAGLQTFVPALREWLSGRMFDCYSAHYWMSAAAGLQVLPEAPWVAMFHTLQATKKEAPGPLGRLRQEAENDIARRCRLVFPTWHDLKVSRPLLPPCRATVIEPGLTGDFRPRDRAEARSRLGLPLDAHIVVGAGRDDPVKNFASLTPEGSLLVLAGPPPARQSDRICLGPLPHEEMPWLFSAADLVVCPSQYETFGLVTLEAMACGACVGVSPGSYWARIFRATGCGFILNETLPAPQMGARARAVAARFAWKRSARRWSRLLLSR